MRRHTTVIAIGVAAALAAVIVVASIVRRGVEPAVDGRGAASTVAANDHPDTAMSPMSGIVDTAAAERSIAALERAHEANPDSVRMALSLGDAYFAARRCDEAAAAYAAALALSPGHPSAATRIAMIWHVRGDDDRAERLIDQVLAAAPDHQEAHYDRAVILFSRQKVAAARQAWARAAEIDPASRTGHASQDFVDLLSGGADRDATP